MDGRRMVRGKDRLTEKDGRTCRQADGAVERAGGLCEAGMVSLQSYNVLLLRDAQSLWRRRDER